VVSKVNGPDGTNNAESVAVTYQTGTMVPIPGLLTNQLRITRTVVMRIKT